MSCRSVCYTSSCRRDLYAMLRSSMLLMKITNVGLAAASDAAAAGGAGAPAEEPEDAAPAPAPLKKKRT